MSSPRRLPLALGLLLLIGALAWWFLPRDPAPAPSIASSPSVRPSTPATIPAAALPPATPAAPPTLADGSAIPTSVALDLNSPRFDITHDLNLLDALFTEWRLNFPRAGHPFGENSEITAALTGDNPLRIPLIPPTHPAINAAGELCDRWGTPFRFHALAGDRMELRSAGPDKKFGSADDVLLTPPGAAGTPLL